MMKKNKGILTAFLVFCIFAGGYIFGYSRSLPSGGIIPNLINKTNNKNVDFGLFWKTWDLLEKKYDGEIDYQKMLYGAISGMSSSLGDPYTVFMTPEQSKLFESELDGTIIGIGTEIAIKKDRLTVVAPIEGSPAEKAGLKPGDLINKIDDTSTEGMSVDTAVSKIRGQENTEVKLLIERDGKEKEYIIKRAKIAIKSVTHEIKNNILIINLSRFDKDTAELVRDAAIEGTEKDVKGVVLDLRNNPGGYLDVSIDVASEFIDKGVIVSEKNVKKGDKKEYKASGKGLLTDKNKYPLVVLVNEGSASASEIVAGAIQDYDRGKLVGEKTFGKGSVQEIEDLSGGSVLKITIAHWYTPNDKNISKEGLTPNFLVKLTDEDYNNNLDPQMDRAVELLR